MPWIDGHFFSDIDGRHVCLHYNEYFMNESPNDSDSVKELRAELAKAKKLFSDREQIFEDLDGPLPTEAEDYAMQLMIANKLLRCWMKATEKDFSSDERHSLIKLTNRLLDGV